MIADAVARVIVGADCRPNVVCAQVIAGAVAPVIDGADVSDDGGHRLCLDLDEKIWIDDCRQ